MTFLLIQKKKKKKAWVLKKTEFEKKFILYLYAWREGNLCKTYKLMRNTIIANKQWKDRIGFQTLRNGDWEDRRSGQTSLITAQIKVTFDYTILKIKY